MLRSIGIMVVNGTRSVFLRSVVPVTLTNLAFFLHGPAPGQGQVFPDPCTQGVCLAVMTDPFVPQMLSIKANKISNAVTAGF